jgi:hypothetical protein
LRNTRNTGQGSFLEASSAQKFTWLLWALTLLFAAIVIACGVVATGADNATSRSWTATAMDRMEKANPDDKELYRSLITKLRDRL